MKVDTKFLSIKQNMSSSSSSKVSSSNSSSSSSKLRKETVFIFFELKKLNKLVRQVLVKSQKKTKTWNQYPHHTLLSYLLSYLTSTCRDTSMTAVLVCSRSAQMFYSLLQSHQPGKHFSCWADLASCVGSSLTRMT